MSNLIELPNFSRTGFVNREDELKQVHSCLQDLRNDLLVEKRTFIFTGQHGIGKSWLLKRLHGEFQELEAVQSYLLDLTDYWHLSPTDAVQRICQNLSAAISANTVSHNRGLQETAHQLIQKVKTEIVPEEIFILLLDTVYEAPTVLLAALEEILLGPLAIEQRVLLVMAGRGREYAWQTPELRLRAEFLKLNPFPVEHTHRQLVHFWPTAVDRAAEIHAISLGNPKASLLFAQHRDRVDALNHVIYDMLFPIRDEERVEIRERLQAFAVPRRFDYNHMPHLLNVYFQHSADHFYPRRQLRSILDSLLNPNLVYWNKEIGAYTLHASMRHLLLLYLCEAHPERYRALHEACILLYQEWVEGKPRNWELWQSELEYHQAELAKLDS